MRLKEKKPKRKERLEILKRVLNDKVADNRVMEKLLIRNAFIKLARHSYLKSKIDKLFNVSTRLALANGFESLIENSKHQRV